MFDDVTVDLVLEKSKERPPVVDECDDVGGEVICIVRFDQLASYFEHRFMRKQVLVQISSLYFMLFILVHITGMASLRRYSMYSNSVIESSSI